MSLRNGIQGPQSILLIYSDFRKILSVALNLPGRLKMWGRRKAWRRKAGRILRIVCILKTSLKDP